MATLSGHSIELFYNGELKDNWYIMHMPCRIGDRISAYEIGTQRFVGYFKVEQINHDMYGYAIVLTKY